MAKHVLIFGTFDRLHPGHEFVLREAEGRGDLTVVIARDRTVKRIKGRAPDQHEEMRRAAVQSFVPFAQVILGDESDYLSPIRSQKPDLILLGYDQALPPGVRPEDLPCPAERIAAYEPHLHKSSFGRSL